MKYVEFENHIEQVKKGNSNLLKCYFITGDDGYLLSHVLNYFKSVLLPDFLDFNFSQITFENNMVDVVDCLTTFPVLDDKKIVVVSDVNGKLTVPDEKLFLDYFANPCEQATLVALCDKDFKNTYSKKVNAELLDCSQLSETETYYEMDRLLNARPAAIMEKSTKTDLYKKTLGNMSRIAKEIEKLKDYAGTTITMQDVDEMVAPDFDYQIYELSNAVSEKNATKAMSVLDSFNKNGIRGVTIINLLYGHYRKMLHVELQRGQTDEYIASLLGIKPQALYHIRKVSKDYTQMRLKKCVDYLHNLQYKILQGEITENNASKDAVITLLTI